jgi:hypothetical protein
LEIFHDHLQSKGIEILAIARNSIEAKSAGEYLAVVDMIRQLSREGWVWKNYKRIIINCNKNTFNNTGLVL